MQEIELLKIRSLFFVMVIAIILAYSSVSQAVSIQFTDLAGTTTISDGDAADTDAFPDAVAGSFASPDVDPGSTFASTKGPKSLTLDSSAFRTHTSIPGATWVIEATQTGFISTPELLGFTTTWGNFVDEGSWTLSSYFDSSNTAFGLGTLLSTKSGAVGGDFGSLTSFTTPLTDPFSLTLRFEYTDPGPAAFGTAIFADTMVEFNESTPVPEPATIALLGIGLVGLAGASVRRRRKRKS